ncbi:MAG: hypothetical protein AMXMBFR13_19110 [Phycisphaerae bacterium]
MGRTDCAALVEEQIRPARLMADKQSCVDADRAFLLARRAEWVRVACPACDVDDPRPYGEKLGFAYVECSACGTVYTNPRPSLDLMQAFYAGSQNYAYWNRHVFPATENIRRERIFRPRARRLAELCRGHGIAGGTLIEVGAAFGTFCQEISEQGLFDHIVAVEPTPDLARTCRQRGLEVLEMFVEDVPDTHPADVMAAFEVIEHLFSPQAFIDHCRRLIRPGGLLVLSCPNVRGFDVATLRMLSNTFDHEHVNYFHPASLALLLGRCGFRVLDIQTPGQLDAELVRKHLAAGSLDLSAQPLLREILVERWDELGGPFQGFLADHQLSSHLWVVAQPGCSEEGATTDAR